MGAGFVIALLPAQIFHILPVSRDRARKQRKVCMESEEIYRRIFIAVNDPIVVFDAETGETLDANPAACRQYGYSHAELLRLKSADLSSEPERSERSVREGDVFIPIRYHRKKDGAVFPAEISASHLTLNGRKLVVATIRDRSVHHTMKEALKESELRYRAVVDDQTELICRYLPDGTLTFVNDACCRLLDRSREELIGSRWQPNVLPDDLAMIEEKLSAQTPATPVATIENRIQIRTGEWRWMQFVNRAFFDDHGRIVENQAVGRDITARKQIESELRQSEEMIRLQLQELDQFYRYSPVGLFAVDRELRYLRINEHLAELNGRSIHEHLGYSIDEVLPPGLAARLKSVWQPVLERGEPLCDLEIAGTTARQPGIMRYWLASYFPLFANDGTVVGLMGAVMDITDRRRMEDALRLASYSVDHVSEEVYWTLADGSIFDANSTACTALGYGKDELLALSIPDINPDISAEMLPVAWEQLKKAGSIQRESRHRTRDGRIYPIECSSTYLEFNGIEYCCTFIRDITGRKQAEELQARYSDELERQVRERTESLTLANELLKDEIRDRQHAEQELRTHQQCLESMALELSMAEERERGRIAGELHDQVGQRLILGKIRLDGLTSELIRPEKIAEAETIKDLLSQSIQDIRSLTFQLRPPILANAGLEPAIRWLGEELRENIGLDVRVTDDQMPKPLPYEIRATLFQAVRELLLNVAKHAGCSSATVDLSRHEDAIVITVAEDGCGFIPADMTSRNSQSRGFGLFNVRQRIEYLGGRFNLHTAPGTGTRVSLQLPLEN